MSDTGAELSDEKKPCRCPGLGSANDWAAGCQAGPCPPAGAGWVRSGEAGRLPTEAGMNVNSPCLGQVRGCPSAGGQWAQQRSVGFAVPGTDVPGLMAVPSWVSGEGSCRLQGKGSLKGS